MTLSNGEVTAVKILIVDDEAINRTLLTNMLYSAGYKHCIEAVNGEEAIQHFIEEQPDLVLLDVVMPGLSGLTLPCKSANLQKVLTYLFFLLPL